MRQRRMENEQRNFLNEITDKFNLPKNTSISDVLKYISFNSIEGPKDQNIVYQYLKKVAKQNKDHNDEIYAFLKTIKRSKFKTFKINIADAFADTRFQGRVEIILNNNRIIPR